MAQEKERNTRERSRRNERPPRREARELTGPLEGELKKPKLEHEHDQTGPGNHRDEDELMDAKGPPVFDLTQRDDDDDEDNASGGSEGVASRTACNPLNDKKKDTFHAPIGALGSDGIAAPTPQLGPVPGSQISWIPWLPCIRNKTELMLMSLNLAMRSKTKP